MNARTLHWFLRVAAEAGLPVQQIVRSAGVEWSGDEDFPELDTWQYARALHQLATVAPLGFGAFCGEQLDFEDMGMVGMAMLTSATLRESTEIWAKYGELAQFPLFGSVQFSGEQWRYVCGPSFPMTDRALQLCTETLVACFGAQTRRLTEHALAYQQVELPFRPDGGAQARRFGVARVMFGRSDCVLVGNAADLDAANRFADRAACTAWLTQCERALEAQQRATSTCDRIFKIFARSRGSLPKVGEVARALGVSTRSLQRSIANEGQTYQGLVNDFRMGLLRILSTDTNLQPKRVAFELRYRNLNNIYRILQKAEQAA